MQEPSVTRAFRADLRRFAQDAQESVNVFDVGANIAYYALQQGELLREGDTVWAIESNPSNVKLLRMNVGRNELSANVVLWEQAIGDASGTAELAISEKSNLSRLYQVEANDADVVDTTTKIQRLDGFDEAKNIDLTRPAVLRMDSEGAEIDILRGAGDLLQQDRDLLLFTEVHLQRLSSDDREYLVSVLEEGRLETTYRPNTLSGPSADSSILKAASFRSLPVGPEADSLGVSPVREDTGGSSTRST